ncbi:MAG: methylenetetrahydrofolate reductase C-terminal domain-containing protein [Candidatus Omnitrophica bacterium]|nr:methylenetetrahydrofolate reductase C-terminal domain-containing protein [Candidatus Omnitrophota bacterium]
MIITKQKDKKTILDYLKNDKNIFITGCAQCATVCKTGGADQVEEIKTLLEKHGKVVTGTVVIDPPCHLVKSKKMYQQNKNEIQKSDAILALACGDGIQSIMEGAKGKKIHPGLDTLFLGEVLSGGAFEQKCLLCAECVLDETGGFCPITLCPKGLLNGPCGGAKNKKCEVDKTIDCVWIKIYERLKDLGQLQEIKRIKPPRDNSKRINPRKHTLEKK